MVEEDDYATVGSILTYDATWTIMPIGYTWSGRRAIESVAIVAGRRRRHDDSVVGASAPSVYSLRKIS
jgi:hypothetical protein